MKRVDRLFYKWCVEQSKINYKNGLCGVILLKDDTAVQFTSFKDFKWGLRHELKTQNVLAIDYVKAEDGYKKGQVCLYERKKEPVFTEYDE